MLIKNTNPNELLAEFERDENFCPYNEEELERLKKEAERLRNDVTCDISIKHNGALLGYNLSNITDKGVRYEYGKYGSIYMISPERYSKECTEYVRFENYNKIVFFYKSTNSDGTVWSVEVDRTGDWSREVWLWFGEEVKFKKVGD